MISFVRSLSKNIMERRPAVAWRDDLPFDNWMKIDASTWNPPLLFDDGCCIKSRRNDQLIESS